MSNGGSNSSGKGGVFDQSAAAMSGAGGAYQQAANMYGSPGLSGTTDKISSGISGYMNPYTNSVIDAAIADQQRLTNLQQGQNAASAVNAGAFGGSRHGLVEAMTNSEAQRNIGSLTSGLRSAGFDTAAGLSAQDIANKNQMAIASSQDQLARAGGLGNVGSLAANLGGQGFNIGQAITGSQGQQGGLQQSLIQNIMDLASGQFAGWQNKPQDMISTVLQAMGMNPLNQNVTQTSTYKPGLLDYLGLGAQLGSAALGKPA